MIKHLRTAAFGAAAVLFLATFVTGVVLDIVFITAAVALIGIGIKYLK